MIKKIFPLLMIFPVNVFAAPAFPGAVGEGAIATGGRNGEICQVTNLRGDNTPGSLQHCLNKNNRIVIFKTGGTIEVSTPITIRDRKNITIAGHTAPGGGITIRGRKTSGSEEGALLIRDSQNIVVRGLTLRPGASKAKSPNVDALAIIDSQNILIDHVSTSWGTDENVSVWSTGKGGTKANDRVTIQNSIVAEGLRHSTHPDGAHGYGLIVGGKHTKKVTLYRNLLSNQYKRFPTVNTGYVDLVNNVMNNPGNGSTVIIYAAKPDVQGQDYAYVNVVGNTLKQGRNTPGDNKLIGTARGSDIGFYEKDNRVLNENHRPVSGKIHNSNFEVNRRYNLMQTPVSSPEEAYQWVLDYAGNSFAVDCDGSFVHRRDTIDSRIVADVNTGSGKMIDHPNDVGGWVAVAQGTACKDSDRDGMPDEWEAKYGLNASTDDSNTDADQDGYTNIEEYLNGTAPRNPNSASEAIPDSPEPDTPADPPFSPAPEEADTPVETPPLPPQQPETPVDTGPWRLYSEGNSQLVLADVPTAILNGDGHPVTLGQKNIHLQAGTDYRLVVSLKGLNVSHALLDVRDKHNGQAIGLENHGLPVAGNNTWQSHEIVFTANESTQNGWIGFTVDNQQVGQFFIGEWTLEALESPQHDTPSEQPDETPDHTESDEHTGCSNAITFEAESGTMMWPFETRQHSNVSGGAYILVPESTRTILKFRNKPPYVEYSVFIPHSGKYRIKGHLHAPTSKANSAFFQIDDGNGVYWPIAHGDHFTDAYVQRSNHGKPVGEPLEYDIEAGQHTFRFFLREDGLKADSFSFEPLNGC